MNNKETINPHPTAKREATLKLCTDSAVPTNLYLKPWLRRTNMLVKLKKAEENEIKKVRRNVATRLHKTPKTSSSIQERTQRHGKTFKRGYEIRTDFTLIRGGQTNTIRHWNSS
jgi:hypothetical protein